MSRATNMAGQTQPLSQEWNPPGYLWNVAQPFPITISAQALTGVAEARSPAAVTLDAYKAACFSCHDEHMMQQQRLTREQWDREINKMTGWGAQVSPQGRDAILNYLSSQFKQ
jgi:hypothetical protein